MTAPKLYDLRNDAHAARFDLQPWERDFLLTRKFPGRAGGRPAHIIPHIQGGTTRGSLDWWVNGPGVEASSHVLINKDGSIVRCIDEKDGAWTNGKVSRPTSRASKLLNRGGNPNNWCLTMELEGQPWDSLPEVQLDAAIWQAQEWMKRYPGITLAPEDILGHRHIDAADRSQCGLFDDVIIARLRADVPTPTLSDPSWGTEVTFSQPTRILVTSQIGVNARKWAETKPYSPIMQTLPHGREFFASGYVYGESVAGENRWYVMSGSGLRVWSGATNQPMLNRK